MNASTLPAKQRVRVPARSRAMSATPEVETSFHAASVNARDMQTWNPIRVSPDSALLPELETIVARSDDLTRNNGFAAGGERTIVDNVVGPRILCKPNPDRITLDRAADWVAEWSPVVEGLWATFADTNWFDAGLRNTFHSGTRLTFKKLVSAGEGLALPLWGIHADSKWRTALQLIDPARLSNPNGKSDNATLRGGIELDAYGAATAYHIRKTHPGDFFVGSPFAASGEWERIPAYMPFGRARVLHVFEQHDVGVTRGKPLIASVVRQFKMKDHFLREKLRLAVLNAMIFATLETPLDEGAQVELLGGDRLKDYQSKMAEWRVQMKGGAVIPTPPGTRLNAFAPPQRDANNIDEFTTVMLRMIAAGMNMPYELLTKDFSKSNYSSARAALLEAWRYFLAARQMLFDNWATPVFTLWFEEAVNAGVIPDVTPDDFYSNQVAWTRCKWICAGRGWVDPVKEADAAAIRMQNGLSTLEDECAEQGKDWKNVLEQQARENAMREQLKLPIPGKVVAQTNYPSDQPQQQQQQQAA